MRADCGIKDSWRKGWNCAMKLIMITVLSEGLRTFIMVDFIAKLPWELAMLVDLSGGGNLVLTAKILPANGITRMLKSWFSGSGFGAIASLGSMEC